MGGNLNERAQQQRGFFERLASWVPGYGGYADRERRREVDKLEREFIAQKLFGLKTGVKRLVDELTTANHYDGLAAYDKLLNKIDKIAQRIRTATYGWSGMFDAVKIGEAELEKLYQYDLGLVEATNEVALAVTELQGLGGDPAAAQAKAKQVLELLDRIDDYFGKRQELVTRG